MSRCCQIMGRNEQDELSGAQILYPCMQCADIFFLKVLYEIWLRSCLVGCTISAASVQAVGCRNCLSWIYTISKLFGAVHNPVCSVVLRKSGRSCLGKKRMEKKGIFLKKYVVIWMWWKYDPWVWLWYPMMMIHVRCWSVLTLNSYVKILCWKNALNMVCLGLHIMWGPSSTNRTNHKCTSFCTFWCFMCFRVFACSSAPPKNWYYQGIVCLC